MSRLFTSLQPKQNNMHCENVCICLHMSLSESHLSSLSPDADMSAWIWGLDFQSSLLGGGRSLTLDALAIFDRLPVLQNNNNCTSSASALRKIHWCGKMFRPSYMYFITYSEQWTITIPSKGECSHTTPHTPSAPITNWKEKAPSQPECLQRLWDEGAGGLPAKTCRTSGSPRSSRYLRRAAWARPCCCPWAPDHWTHPDTPHTGSSQEGPENPCYFDLDGEWEMTCFSCLKCLVIKASIWRWMTRELAKKTSHLLSTCTG